MTSVLDQECSDISEHETQGETDPLWGCNPSILALAAPDRLNEIPSGFRQGEHSLKDHNGICVGRKDELRRISQYFGAEWLAEKRGEAGTGKAQERGFAHVITNAPGAGKSTLLVEFGLQESARGVVCPLLAVGDFERPDQIVRKLCKFAEEAKDGFLPGWLQDAVNQAIRNRNLGDVAGGALAALGEPEMGLAAKLVLPNLQAAGRALARLLRTDPPETVEQALERYGRATEGKFIIMVDEAHNWLKNDVNRNEVRYNIGKIADLGQRGAAHVQGGGLLVAGLGSLTRREDELGLTRAGTTWLGPLTREQAETVILRTIMATETTSEREHRVGHTWAKQLSNEFSSWPQHTAAAARVTRLLLQATDPDADSGTAEEIATRDAKHLEWARTMTAEQVARLYDARLGAATEAIGAWGAPAVIALANRHGGRLPMDATLETIRIAMMNDRRSAIGTVVEPGEGLMQLMGAGVLRTALAADGVSSDEYHLEIAMPSLQRYATEKIQVTAPDVMRKAEQMADAGTEAAQQIILPQSNNNKHDPK